MRTIQEIYNWFQAALNRAGVRKMRFRDLRHPVATRLVANGIDLMKVKEFMAHSSLATTQRYMKKAVDILDGF